jgi:hypothetical protein
MPEWKQQIQERLAPLKLAPMRESSIVEELSAYMDDCYSELLAGGTTADDAYRQALEQLGSSEVLMRELQRVALETALPTIPQEQFNGRTGLRISGRTCGMGRECCGSEKGSQRLPCCHSLLALAPTPQSLV